MPTIKRLSLPPRPKSQAWGQRKNRWIYQGARWKKISQWFRRTERGLFCVVCGIEGTQDKPLEVDHITPIECGGAIYDEDNLQALCKSCHTKKTNQERDASKRYC